MTDNINIAIYWGAGCGGCDVAILDIDEQILDLHALADIVFWPIGFDHKLEDLEAMGEDSIAVAFYNGAIRNSENEHVARILRDKAQFMIAFGTCATHGGIPALANLTDRDGIFDYVYKDLDSNDNPDGVVPKTRSTVPEGELELPEIYDHVYPLDEIVDVDYFMPGCPPTTNLIADALTYIVNHVKNGEPMPPKGTVIAQMKSLCDQCPRTRTGSLNIERIYQPYEIEADEDDCLL